LTTYHHILYNKNKEDKKMERWTTARIKRSVLDEIKKIKKIEQRSIPTIIERAISLYKKMVHEK